MISRTPSILNGIVTLEPKRQSECIDYNSGQMIKKQRGRVLPISGQSKRPTQVRLLQKKPYTDDKTKKKSKKKKNSK